jgi:hypothetical protein
MQTSTTTARTPAMPYAAVGRMHNETFSVGAPSPLAGVVSTFNAGSFLKRPSRTQLTDEQRLSDAELGEAIFRFVFQRY